jgi:outer membrane protein assembly factor BamB
MSRFLVQLGALSLIAGLAISACAADWPTWRGPYRNGITNETDWQTRWSGSGPRKVWSARVGTGYSSCVVGGGKLYTTGSQGGRDTIFCLNAENGAVIWRYSYPHGQRDYQADPNPTGTGSTPTLDGGSLHVLSRDGVAFCLNANTGRVLWQRDLRRETGAELPTWGFTSSPFVDGSLVIYNVGGSGCALNKTTGQIVWKSRGLAGYATPVSFTSGNQRAIALFAGRGIVGVDPASGRVLWQYGWQTSYEVNAADPLVAGDTIFISSGYNKGGSLIRVTGNRAAAVYSTPQMRTQFNSAVLINGFIYGNDAGRLTCMELRTGNVKWSSRGMGNGALIASGNNLIVITERGELIVAEANPQKYTEVSRARVLDGTCWTQPVLANGRLYLRNNDGDLICLDVRR